MRSMPDDSAVPGTTQSRALGGHRTPLEHFPAWRLEVREHPRWGLGLSLKDKRDEGLGAPLVLRILFRKRLHHEAFFCPGAVHTVDRHHYENRQPDRAGDESRSEEGQQHSRVNGMAYVAIRTAGHQVMALLEGHRHPPISAQMESGPHGECKSGET